MIILANSEMNIKIYFSIMKEMNYIIEFILMMIKKK